ncbi:hypothetical protein GCU60_12845 [Blastococcus saxobsidens]|uniref:Uncharacterized protein n=1 Tax=Blastococcus saxobsidens TaxID=138336 RepID=A0A6L9W5H9_9ACTN|nr:hypothetical protein [Blastococcus saxobsidens]NEK86634.1 hypothetical protein [Blastococcus saxobsidens]
MLRTATPQPAMPASPTTSFRRAAGLLSTSPVGVAAACALVLALLVEAAPVVGGDLVAQEWWASWATTNRAPVDLGWYGGVTVASYSLLSPWAGGLLGLPLVGILGTVLGAAATTALLGRLHPSPARWTAAGVTAAATFAANEWSGRTTFGLGAALGCLALLAATRPGRRGRLAGAVLAALAGATSPVAAAFLVLAAAAWWIGAQPGMRLSAVTLRPVAPWWIAGGALLSVALARLLGAVSGPQPTSAHQMLAAVAAAGLTAALLPSCHRALRAGAVFTAVLLLATWLVSSPVGSTSTRLVLLFAVPVLVAAARTRPAVTFLAAVAVVWLLPPVVVRDLMPREPGPPAPQAESLLAELRERGPVGRIEVVPLNSHEESMSVAQGVPLARGWLRQLDTVHAGLFYDGTLDAGTYLDWLRDAGVSFVVLPSGPLDWPTGGEARLLREGVPGLREVWSDRSWRLFEVSGGGILRGNATLVSSDRSRLVVDVRAAGQVEVALRWSQWSSVAGPGGCVRPGDRDGWTTLTAERPGRYVLTSSWLPGGRCD